MKPKDTVPQFRIEAGGTGIGPHDLRPWGELRGHVAWTVLSFAETECRDRAARLRLLESFTDDIIRIVSESMLRAAERRQDEESTEART